MRRDPQYLAYGLAVLAASCLLLVALADMPGWYYTALRWVVCATTALGVFRSSDLWKSAWLGLLGGVGVLFNPVVPFHLDREIWGILDVLGAVVLLSSLWGLRPPSNSNVNDSMGNESGPVSNAVTIEIPNSDAPLQYAFEMSGRSPAELYLAALRKWDDDEGVEGTEESEVAAPIVDSYFDSFDEHQPSEPIIVDTCEQAGDPVLRKSFHGRWLVRNQGSTIPDGQGIWSLAITRRGQIAVYRYRVDAGVKTAQLRVYSSLRDAGSGGVPSDIVLSAERLLDRRFIQELDI